LQILYPADWGVDFVVFHRAAARVLIGDWGIYNTTPMVLGWDFLYPRQSLLLFAPFALLSFDMGFLLFTAVGIILCAVSFWVVNQLVVSDTSTAVGMPVVSIYLMLAANFAVWMTLFNGQVSFYVLFTCVGFLWALRNKRYLFAGALISAGILLKLYPAVMLAAPLFRRKSWSAFGWALAAAVIASIATLVFVPWDLFEIYLFNQLPRVTGKASVYYTNQSIVSFVARLFVPRQEWFEFSHSALSLGVRYVIAATTVVCGLYLGLLAARGAGRRATVSGLALCALTGVVTAGSFMYVFVASLPLFCVVLGDSWVMRRQYPLLASFLPFTMVCLFVPSWTRLPFGDRVPAIIENLVYTRSSIITCLFIGCGLFLASRIQGDWESKDETVRQMILKEY
jgi:glycosyl transferase family 87